MPRGRPKRSQARMKGIASTVALAVLVIVVTVGSIGGCVAVALPHGTYGLHLAWIRPPGAAQALTVTSVMPGSPAGVAGIEAGDVVASTPSFSDQIAIALQSTVFSGVTLAAGTPVTFQLERNGAYRTVQLVAVPGAAPPAPWLRQLRQVTYTLAVFAVAALVLLRPTVVTWSFALFVILATQPSLSMLRFVGMARMPVLYLAANIAVQLLEALGYIGLVAFAARFPSHARERRHRPRPWDYPSPPGRSRGR